MTIAGGKAGGASASGERRGHLRLVPGAHACIAAEFQPDAVEVEERKPPRLARVTLYAVAALLVGGVGWAWMSNVDEVVSAQGRLVTSAPRIVVQPLETSVIRSLDVKIGDAVRQGQVLARLDPTFSEADRGQIEARILGFDAQIARLEAELQDRPYSPGETANAEEVLQKRMYLQRQNTLKAALANFDEQIARDKASLTSGEQEEKLLGTRRETMLEIEKMRATLLDHQTGSRLNYLTSKDARLDVEANIQRLRGKQLELAHSIEKGKAERQSTIEEFRRTGMEQLVDARTKRAAAAEELKKVELRRKMVELVAPADGVVLDIAQRSIGSVVKEAETLFVVVPQEGDLEAEVQLEGKDVGHIEVGQPVRIKFDAFPFQRHGTARGSVRLISQDAFQNEQKSEQRSSARSGSSNAVYRVRVQLGDTRLKRLPEAARLLPGMSLTAEVKVGHRSVLSYVTYPLMKGLDESLKEPR